VKQIMGGFFLALMLYAVPALAEIGFAEVRQSDVNLRETPGGARVCYLDAGYDVYVFEEKLVNGQLWCHVYTDVRQRTRAAWIRGDMLRFLSDEFYDVVSAMIKSIRGSDPDAAIYYVARLLRLGAPPEYIARRLVISAAEDIGLANPQALPVATAAVTGVMTVGMPEAEIILAEAAIFLATSPKSRSTYDALQAAYQAMDHHPEYETAPIPSAFRNHAFDFTSTGEEQRSEYKNPHDDPRGILTQQYLPSCMGTPEYYHPTTRGFEQGIHATLPALRSILHDPQ